MAGNLDRWRAASRAEARLLSQTAAGNKRITCAYYDVFGSNAERTSEVRLTLISAVSEGSRDGSRQT